MPNDIQHLDQIRRSEKLLESESLNPQTAKYLEWTVTIIFYSAVHVIEWYFAKNNLKDSKGHDDRRQKMGKLSALKNVTSKYDLLKSESWKARYNCARYRKEDIPTYMKYLSEIEKAVGL